MVFAPEHEAVESNNQGMGKLICAKTKKTRITETVKGMDFIYGK